MDLVETSKNQDLQMDQFKSPSLSASLDDQFTTKKVKDLTVSVSPEVVIVIELRLDVL
jgi:hypothetical protein